MLYGDYKIAAQKHLNTCKAMVDSIDRLSADNASLIAFTNKKDALHNIYYLSGYVLESISTYGIYKHYGWSPGKSVKQKDQAFSLLCDFTYYPNDGFQYFVHTHQFQANQFEVLKVPLSTSGVPIVDSSVPVSMDLFVLFNNWSPKIRYQGPNLAFSYLGQTISLNDDIVKRFVKLTESVYNSLLNIVG